MCAISRSNAVARSTSTQPFMLVLGMRFLYATLSITLKEHKTFSVHPNFAQVRNDSALRFYFSFLFSVPADASHLFFFSAVLWLGLMARTQRLKGHNGKMERVEGKEGGRASQHATKNCLLCNTPPEADALQRAHFLTLAAGPERKKHNRSWRRPPG